MDIERTLARWISETRFEDLPPEAVAQMKRMTTTIIGTTVAGATSEGCLEAVDQVREWGGAEQSTVLIHGGKKVPAHSAALANSVMARALDICDGMTPGIHVGSSLVPVGLAVAEAVGGCSGEDFLAALATGSELTARISAIADYDGFDPTGIGTIFGVAAVAGRLLGLTTDQMHHALALAFNRAAGSFQSNIDGSLAVRYIQGFISQNGIMCAELARRGITGPNHYITGLFGYYHLYCKDKRDDGTLAADLGTRWSMYQMGFKSAPSCGCTIAPTDLILKLVEEHHLEPADVESIDVTVGPPVYRLTGHDFKIGDNPTVDAQFNIQFCVANGLLRRSSKLAHFNPEAVRSPIIADLVRRIRVHCNDSWVTETRMDIRTRNGSVYSAQTSGPSGFPPFDLTAEQHRERFLDNVSFGGKPLPQDNIQRLVSSVETLEGLDNVCALVPDMISP